MKILYLIKERGSLTNTLKEIIDAQVLDGNEVLVINFYEENANYDILIDDIFDYDEVVCF